MILIASYFVCLAPIINICLLLCFIEQLLQSLMLYDSSCHFIYPINMHIFCLQIEIKICAYNIDQPHHHSTKIRSRPTNLMIITPIVLGSSSLTGWYNLLGTPYLSEKYISMTKRTESQTQLRILKSIVFSKMRLPFLLILNWLVRF